jgi:hypothetical protein
MSDSAATSAPDNDYVSRPGQKDAPIPVEKDSETVESGVNPETEDSDAQLGKSYHLITLQNILTHSLPCNGDTDEL